MPRFTKPLFLAASLTMLATPVAASPADALWDARFADAAGAQVPLPTLAAHDTMLVVFWASWCAPCRDEMARLAARRDQLGGVDVVAVSADDPAGWPTAQTLLATLAWPFSSLWDEGGAQLYKIQTSGELPVALVYSRSGRLLGRYGVLTPEILAAIAAQRPSAATLETGPWTVSDVLEARSQRVGTSRRPAGVLANEATVAWHKQAWTFALAHDYLRQRPAGSTSWARPEDELGPSYAEWSDKEPPASLTQLRVRVGDDGVAILGGALLEARRRPDTNEAATVQGLLVEAAAPAGSLLAGAGRIRDRLFPFELDASRNLSVPGPDERAAFALARVRGPGATHAAIGAVRYVEPEDVRAGVPTTHTDERYGALLGWGDGARGAEGQIASYHPRTATAGAPAPLGRSAQLNLRIPVSASLGLTLQGMQGVDLPPRTALPELTEEPFLPLALGDRSVYRIAPTMALGDAGFAVLSYVHDADAANGALRTGDRQETGMLRWTGPTHGLAVEAGRQLGHSATLGRDYTEAATGGGVDLIPGLHGSILDQRFRATDGDAGDRCRSRLDADIDRLVGLSGAVRASVAVVYVRQTAHYIDLSGINGGSLIAGEATLGTEIVSVRLAAGREPGGLVCTGGSCAQRAPLNGASLSLSTELNF